jgi:hypothetical protein
MLLRTSVLSGSNVILVTYLLNWKSTQVVLVALFVSGASFFGNVVIGDLTQLMIVF